MKVQLAIAAVVLVIIGIAALFMGGDSSDTIQRESSQESTQQSSPQPQQEPSFKGLGN